MADATEKLQKLKSAVDGLKEMSDREKCLFLSLVSRHLRGEAQHIERSMNHTYRKVSLNELPVVHGDSSTLLDQFAVVKVNGGVTVLDHTKNVSSDVKLHSVSHIKYPSILADGLMPWPSKDGWYSPGDVLTPMWTSSVVDSLLEEGREYAFISDADNLGAVVELRILNHVIKNNIDYCMEVADSLDPTLGFYNLWVNVKALKKLLDADDLKLEIIPKLKEVDGVRILQLETEVDSAIKFFNNAILLTVPPSRFQKLPRLDQDTHPRELAPFANEIVEYNEVQNNDFVNILASECVEADIFASKKEMEGESCVSVGYMDNRGDISKSRRQGLINWVMKLHERLGLMEESLHLTVQIIDRFFAVHQAMEGNLRDVGAAAISLASKFEGENFDINSVMVNDETYTLGEVIAQELLIARTLKFRLGFPTPYLFMRLFLLATNSEIQIEPICLFFIELCEFEMVESLPSMLAASTIYTAQCTVHQSADAERLANLSTVSGYPSFAIEDMARMMVTLHRTESSYDDEKRSKIKALKLLCSRELNGKLIHVDKKKSNFQEEIYKTQASAPRVWKYSSTGDTGDAALKYLQTDIQTIKGLSRKNILVAGSTGGCLSLLRVARTLDEVWSHSFRAIISSIHLIGRYDASENFHHVNRALITTLGSVAPGSVTFLNLTDGVNTITRQTLHGSDVSPEWVFWTADCNISGSHAALGTDIGAKLVDLETGAASHFLRSESDVPALQFDQSGSIVHCGLRNGSIVSLDLRERPGRDFPRLTRHQIRHQPSSSKTGQTSTNKEWFELQGNINPSHHLIYMPSSLICLKTLKTYDQYLMASSMDGTMKLYDQRMVKRGVAVLSSNLASTRQKDFLCQEEKTDILAFGVSNLVNFCLKINSPTLPLRLCVGLPLKGKETGMVALFMGHGLDRIKN